MAPAVYCIFGFNQQKVYHQSFKEFTETVEVELLNALFAMSFVVQNHDKMLMRWHNVALIAAYNTAVIYAGRHFLYIHLVKIYFEIRIADFIRHKVDIRGFLNLVYTHLLSQQVIPLFITSISSQIRLEMLKLTLISSILFNMYCFLYRNKKLQQTFLSEL